MELSRSLSQNDREMGSQPTKRSVGRRQIRRLNDIKDIAGNKWYQTAMDRGAFRTLGKAYAQQWPNNICRRIRCSCKRYFETLQVSEVLESYFLNY